MLSQSNIYKLLSKELPKQGVRVSESELRETLLSHPHYPSVQSICDCFGDLGIATMSVRITAAQLRDALSEAQAILFLEEKGESYPVWVKSINDTQLVYSANGKRDHTESIETLMTKWKGVTLLFQTEGCLSGASYERDKQQKKQKSLYYTVAIIGVLFALGAAIYSSGEALRFSAMLLPKLLGLFFAVLLVATELGFKLPVAEKLCAISTNEGCDKVMHSKAASLTKQVKLADVGLVYFVGVLLCQTLFSGSVLYQSGMQTLAILSLCCLPFVLFSVSYQTFVLKAYCPLCLSVMAMLCADFVVYWAMGYLGWALLSPLAIIAVLGVLFTISGAWMLAKPSIEKKQQLQQTHYRYQQLRRDPERIAHMLSGLKEEDMGNGLCDIVLGSKNAKVVFTEVINPYCGPCGHAIGELLPLLEIFPDSLQVRIRFTGRDDEPESKRTLTSQHLLSYAAACDAKDMEKALVAWYADMSYDAWKLRFPVAASEAGKAALPRHLEWSKQAEITHTPTSFINGKRLPSRLKLGDMRYYIGELLEE